MTDHDLTRPAPWEQIDGLDFEDRYGVLRLLLLVLVVVPVLIVASVFALVWWLGGAA